MKTAGASSSAGITTTVLPIAGLTAHDFSQVSYIASSLRRRLPPSVEFADLVNTGMVGLLEAYGRFDGAKDTKFKTFANFRIRGAILDSLRRADWASRTLRRNARKVTEATARLEGRMGRDPNQFEIAHEMNVETRQLQKILAELDRVKLAGQTAIAAADGSVTDTIESAPDLADPGPFELCQLGEMNAFLAHALSELTKREQLILSLYYREELTMGEIAIRVGIAVSRVSQIHQVVLKKLKSSLAYLDERPANHPAEW